MPFLTEAEPRPSSKVASNGAVLERRAASADALLTRFHALPEIDNAASGTGNGPEYHFIDKDGDPTSITVNTRTTTVGSGDRSVRLTINVHTGETPTPESLDSSLSLVYVKSRDNGKILFDQGVRLEVRQRTNAVTLISNMGQFPRDGKDLPDPMSTMKTIWGRLRRSSYVGEGQRSNTQAESSGLTSWMIKNRAMYNNRH